MQETKELKNIETRKIHTYKENYNKRRYKFENTDRRFENAEDDKNDFQ